MVVNAPQSNIVSAAELAVGLLIASARATSPRAQRLAQGGGWKRSRTAGWSCSTRGRHRRAGSLGALVAERLAAFEMRSWRTTPTPAAPRPAQIGVRLVAGSTSSWPSPTSSRCTCPGTRDRGLMGERSCEGEADCPVVNAARGGIVDEAALAARWPTAGWPAPGSTCTPTSRAPTARCSVSSRSWSPRTWAPAPTRPRRKPASRWPGRCASRSAVTSSPTRSTSMAAAIAEEVRPGWRSWSGSAGFSPRWRAGWWRVDVEVRGEIAVMLSVWPAVGASRAFRDVVEEQVSYVNAPVIAEQRGVEVCSPPVR